MFILVLISSLVGVNHKLELLIDNIVGTFVGLSEELFILCFCPHIILDIGGISSAM